MSFSRLHKLVAYLLAGLGLFGLTLGDEISMLSTAAIAVGFVASWFAEGPSILKPSYGTAWTTAVVIAFAMQIARALLDGPSLALAIEFAAFLQVSRLFTRRTAVDYQQIAVLAFVHLVAATVLSTSLSYGLTFIGFVIATPWMLALSHLRREIEGNYAAEPVPGAGGPSGMQRVLASRRVIGGRFLAGTALLSVPLFAMTLSIFVVIPRVGKGFLSFRRESGQKVAGFGDQIELGGFGVIRDDPTVVVRVTPPMVDEKGPRLSLRLRGTSFDRYDGRRWTRSVQEGTPLRSESQEAFPLRRAAAKSDIEYKIVLEHLDEPVVFLPEGTVALTVPPRSEHGQSFARRLIYSRGFDLRYDADGAGLIYTAWIGTMPGDETTGALLPELRAHYLQMPGQHERVAELAKQVVGDATEPLEQAERIVRFLQGGSLSYSLDQPEVGNRPPLEVFLFEAKRGHCEYFSSAMAIMLRTLGVPTRNVTGFVGGRYNPYGRYYALRQGDAHSWVEVLDPERGWVSFDPTPPSRAAVGPSSGLWSDVNAFVDAMRARWMTTVVGYDLRTQVGILRRIGKWLAAHQPKGLDAVGQGEGGDTDLGAMLSRAGRVLGGLLVVIALGVAVYFVARRKRDGARPGSQRAEAAVRLYGELERALAKHGQPRPAAATPLEHARTIEQRGLPYSEDVTAVTLSYLEARFGERELSGDELAALRAAVERVRAPRPAEQASKPRT